MTRDAALSTVLARAQDQIESGIRELVAGRAAEAEVWIRAARASLAILAAGAPAPLRKMAVVHAPPREEDADPEWFARKANDPEGAA